MTTLIYGAVTGAIIFGLTYSLLALIMLAVERVRSTRRADNTVHQPGVSVFKPLKGLDEQLENNLRSFFHLDYPEYELLFGLADYDDPAIDVVRRLQREYPDVDSRLVINAYRVGLNPKVSNLYNLHNYAKYDRFVISDSNVRVLPAYLNNMIDRMQSSDVGLVTSMVRGRGEETLGAALENLHLNTVIAASVFAVRRLFGVPVTIGKSMLIRRATLEQLGGFEAFAEYLLEDGLLGRRVRALGLRNETCVNWVDNVNRCWDVRRFLARHLRWAVMRRHFNPGHYVAEILSSPITLALVMLLWQRDDLHLNLFLAVALCKTILDLGVATVLNIENRWYHFVLLPVKELVVSGLWLTAFLRRTVVWRGNRFRISRLTRLSPLSSPEAGRGRARLRGAISLIISVGKYIARPALRLGSQGYRKLGNIIGLF